MGRQQENLIANTLMGDNILCPLVSSYVFSSSFSRLFSRLVFVKILDDCNGFLYSPQAKISICKRKKKAFQILGQIISIVFNRHVKFLEENRCVACQRLYEEKQSMNNLSSNLHSISFKNNMYLKG